MSNEQIEKLANIRLQHIKKQMDPDNQNPFAQTEDEKKTIRYLYRAPMRPAVLERLVRLLVRNAYNVKKIKDSSESTGDSDTQSLSDGKVQMQAQAQARVQPRIQWLEITRPRAPTARDHAIKLLSAIEQQIANGH